MMKYNTKNIKKLFIQSALTGLVMLSCPVLIRAEEETGSPLSLSTPMPNCHNINFNDVPIIEFIRFVSRISHVNFIFDNQDLQFNITFSTGKSVSSDDVLKALMQMLQIHGFSVVANDNYYVIHRMDEPTPSSTGDGKSSDKTMPLLESSLFKRPSSQAQFFVYKLQYHQGCEIEEAVKKIATDLSTHPNTSPKLLNAIQSIQWVKSTNSLLCSADEETLESLKKLIGKLDVPSRQVFIEVLVIETDVRKSMDFGLEWATKGQYQGKIGFGGGTFSPGPDFPPGENGSLAHGIGTALAATGLDIGVKVIGDIILHKGKSYLSLGSLVSALQMDGDSTIVLNQKIITQDNKNSKVFVGDNIPFTGSVIQTIGQSQQTTANIEYRDIGVRLSITPMLGEGDIITLDIDEEISESLDHNQNSTTAVNGIRTTKTNMATHVHVPDKHFLVLSGMIRNAKSHHKTGIPCLGGLPVIGALFSKTRERDEKRNVIIFVRPSIIHTFEDYNNVTLKQEDLYRRQSQPADFESGLKLLPPLGEE
jgi:type III secretion protein C